MKNKKLTLLIALSIIIILTFFPLIVYSSMNTSTVTNTDTDIATVTDIIVEESTESAAAPIEETESSVVESSTPVPALAPTTTTSTDVLLYSARYNVCSNPLTPAMGVKYYNGHKETWYSQKVLPGGGLKIPGRHVADDGTIRDEEGYICIATDLSFASRYSIIMTSLGPGKVYDTGCAYGIVDIYVNW